MSSLNGSKAELRTGSASVAPRNAHHRQPAARRSFAPGSVFAFVRWASNDYGTILSRIDILRAVAPGERFSTVPNVRPGGESLLHLSGWRKVEKVLQAIDAVEALGIDPTDAAPDHWRHVHNRLSAGDQARPYSRTRLEAWLHWRKLTR